MMNHETIAKFLTACKQHFPQNAPSPEDLTNRQFVGDWLDLLSKFSVETLREAYKDLIANRKQAFFPRPAEVVEICEKIEFGVAPTLLPQEAVAQIEHLMSKYGAYYEAEAFEEMSPLAREVCIHFNGGDWQAICDISYKNLEYTRKHWLEIAENLVASKKTEYLENTKTPEIEAPPPIPLLEAVAPAKEEPRSYKGRNLVKEIVEGFFSDEDKKRVLKKEIVESLRNKNRLYPQRRRAK